MELSETIMEINDLRGFVNPACALAKSSFPLWILHYAPSTLELPTSTLAAPAYRADLADQPSALRWGGA
jgi:hypothetical protein